MRYQTFLILWIYIILAPLKLSFVASWQDATKKLNGTNLYLHYEESLVSSNLNSKPLWFHSVRPNIGNRKEKMATILVQKFWDESKARNDNLNHNSKNHFHSCSKGSREALSLHNHHHPSQSCAMGSNNLFIWWLKTQEFEISHLRISLNSCFL